MTLTENPVEAESDERAAYLELLWLIGQVYFLLSRGWQQEVNDYPVSFDAIWFLETIRVLGENATQSDIARLMVRKQNTVSDMLYRLGKKGFVKKEKLNRPNNRACNKIEMTKQGKQVYHQLAQKADILFDSMSILTPEESQMFRHCLFKIRGAAAQRNKNYEEPPYPSP